MLALRSFGAHLRRAPQDDSAFLFGVEYLRTTLRSGELASSSEAVAGQEGW